MSVLENIKDKFKQFKPTSWVIDNKTVTYVATIVITLLLCWMAACQGALGRLAWNGWRQK